MKPKQTLMVPIAQHNYFVCRVIVLARQQFADTVTHFCQYSHRSFL